MSNDQPVGMLVKEIRTLRFGIYHPTIQVSPAVNS
jgi:hypothetical protein